MTEKYIKKSRGTLPLSIWKPIYRHCKLICGPRQRGEGGGPKGPLPDWGGGGGPGPFWLVHMEAVTCGA
jgi:hypothetical protein